MGAPLIELTDVTKLYTTGDIELRALDGVSLSIDEGEFVAFMGTSGSGKSTLMNIAGCLDRTTSGKYRLAGDLSPRGSPQSSTREKRRSSIRSMRFASSRARLNYAVT